MITSGASANGFGLAEVAKKQALIFDFAEKLQKQKNLKLKVRTAVWVHMY